MNKQINKRLIFNRFLAAFKCILILVVVTVSAQAQEIKLLDPISSSSFRGLDVFNDSIWWVSGQHNTVMKTEDAGKSWTKMLVGDTTFHTDYRDIAVLDAKTALVMGITRPAIIYKTVDGGMSWKKVYENRDTLAFLDGFDFWDKKRGICLADPIAERWSMLVTKNGGNSWKSLPRRHRPDAQPLEAAFAAGGTAIRTYGSSEVAFVTGGAESSRMLFSMDKGKNWSYLFPLMASSKSAGIFSLDKNSKGTFIMVGGDYANPGDQSSNIGMVNANSDSAHVTVMDEKILGGYRCTVRLADNKIMIATGDGGSDISFDDGQNWEPLGEEGFYTVDCAGSTCVLSGKKGKIGLIRLAPGQ